MSKKSSLRKSLVASALSLTLSASMLVGTTFAWFTDSVTSTGNRIQAGTLDVDLYKIEADGKEVEVTNDSDAIFDYALWEPGYSDAVVLKVVNDGTLALKFKLDVVLTGSVGDADITDVIEVWSTDPSTTAIEYPTSFDGYTYRGTLTDMMAEDDGAVHGNLASKAVAYQGIILKMSEEAGNEYQGAVAEFDIRLNATQYTTETDGFGDPNYDAGADYEGEVSTASELATALEKGQSVKLTDDIVLTETIKASENKDVVINLNGNTISTNVPTEASYASAAVFAATGDADITVTGGVIDLSDTSSVSLMSTKTTKKAEHAVYYEGTGNVKMENVTIIGSSTPNKRVVEINGGTAELTNVTIENAYGTAVNASSGANVTLNNCNITINGMYQKPYNSVCFSAMYGASVTVNGGNYKMINDNAYATGNTHGGWLAIVMSSGGTMYIYDGTFENVPAAGFVPSAERSLFHTDGSPNKLSMIYFYGGKFKPQSATEFTTDPTFHKVWEKPAGDADAMMFDCTNMVSAATAEDLQTAVWAGQSVTLTEDVAITSSSTTNALPYEGDNSFLIDLNGHKITTTLSNSIFRIKNGGTKANSITIKNGTLETNDATWCTVIAAGNTAQTTVNLENVTIRAQKANSQTIKAFAGGTINVTECTVNTADGGGVEACGGTVNVLGNDNVFTQAPVGATIYNANNLSVSAGGMLNVYGGEFTSSWASLVVMSTGGTINVYGGEFATTTADTQVIEAGVDGQWNIPVASATLNLYGGTFDNTTTEEVNDGLINVWDWIPTDAYGCIVNVYPDAVYGSINDVYGGASVNYVEK